MDYLLDTNILLIYVRAGQVARGVEKDLKLMTGDHNLTTSIVSVGEIKSIAIKNNWGNRKIKRLEELLDNFLVADINVEEIVDKYAEIDAYSQGKLSGEKVDFSSRNMGKNDLWIAATGSVLKMVLITADSDFDHLGGKYLKIKKLNLNSYLKK